MRPVRHAMIGLALAVPVAAQTGQQVVYPPNQQGPNLPAPLPPPPKYLPANPVPPQFRGQPVSPPGANGGSGLVPASGPGAFRPAQQLPAAVALPAIAKPQAAVAPQAAVPAVLIEKRGPETVNAGSPLVYEIFVRNVGQGAVQNVRVEDELPGGTRYLAGEPAAEVIGEKLVWNLGGVEAGAERKLRVQVQPALDGDFRSTALVTFSTAAVMQSRVVRPKLNVAMSGPEGATAGDPVTLQIQVSNPGTGPVQGLALRVKLPPGLPHANGHHIEAELGTLPAGETKNIPLRVTATAGGAQQAEVTATGEGGLEAGSNLTMSVAQPMLHLQRAGTTKVFYRGEVTEELEITNPGNAPAADVKVMEVLPAGMDFVAASDGGQFDPAGRLVTWKLGPHAPGAVRKLTLKAKASAVGELTTRAVATAERGIEARVEGAVAVEGIPALALEVVDLEDPVEVGGELTYEIRVVNQGSCPCTNIRITAEAPEGLTPGEATGPMKYRVEGNQVVFEPLPKLATKADVVYRIKVRGTLPNDYRFRVQMNCDQMRAPVNKEESSRVYQN